LIYSNYLTTAMPGFHKRPKLAQIQHTMTLKQSKAKMCNWRRHVPLCPASANEKYIVQKCNYNTMLPSVFI